MLKPLPWGGLGWVFGVLYYIPFLFAFKPVVYRGVIVAAYAEGTCRQHAAVFDVGLCAFPVQYVQKHAVFGLARHDDNVVEVLCSGAYQRNAAYVNLFYYVGLACSARNGGLR